MSKLKILIAEDDLAGRKVLEFFLKPFGVSSLAADGEQALAMYNKAQSNREPFDLIMLDIGMPKLAGLQVLKAIREDEKSLNLSEDKQASIIMLTGSQDMVDINTAIKLGACDYLIKPIEEEKLIKELRRLGVIEDEVDSF